MISLFSPDEHIQYPTALSMLSGGNLKDALHKFILYGDYSYGFPFYGGSALVLLPLKLTNALNSQNVQLAMLLLRQFISVLPMLLAILLMVYTQTKFRSYFTSIITFIFLLSIYTVVENDLWWHADSLAVLFVVFVFFFLDRDELKFGINFRLAAVACGLAAATKVLGLFFFITIPVYILIGIQQKKISWKQALPAAIIFVALLALVIVASDPFPLDPKRTQSNVDARPSHDEYHNSRLHFILRQRVVYMALGACRPCLAAVSDLYRAGVVAGNLEIVQASSASPDPLLGRSIFLLCSLRCLCRVRSLLSADLDPFV